MKFPLFGAAALMSLAVGCASVPAVNTATISTTPASASSMAMAKRVVEHCAKLPDTEAMLKGLESMGYKRGQSGYVLRNGQSNLSPVVSSTTGPVRFNAGAAGCTIGVNSMTPDQSFALVQPWVRKYNAKTNAELGQGLSPQVVQAWRDNGPNSDVYISAFKTWGYDTGMTSTVPGAAVKLSYFRR